MYGGRALHGFNLSTPEFNISPNEEDAFVDTIEVYSAGHRNEKILFGRAGSLQVRTRRPRLSSWIARFRIDL
jgi:hypothetical protein